MNRWTLLCDFDGTIALSDVTDLLLERFAMPGWEALEQQWRDGLIGSAECMAGQVALIDASRAELDAAIDEVVLDPDFAAFVEVARGQGTNIVVVSDGLDYAIRRLLARAGLADLAIVANRLEPDGERRWTMQSPHRHADCRSQAGTCKCRQAALLGADRSRILLVGDGRSDYCVAEAADVVFAKASLKTHCQRKGIRHHPIDGFADALALLPRLSELLIVDPPLPIFQGIPTHA